MLLVCLHGGNEPDTRIRSALLLRDFIFNYGLKCPVIDYIDNQGYWVFCMTMFVNDQYSVGEYAKAWGKIMKVAGIPGAGAANYERLLDFGEAIAEGEYLYKGNY